MDRQIVGVRRVANADSRSSRVVSKYDRAKACHAPGCFRNKSVVVALMMNATMIQFTFVRYYMPFRIDLCAQMLALWVCWTTRIWGLKEMIPSKIFGEKAINGHSSFDARFLLIEQNPIVGGDLYTSHGHSACLRFGRGCRVFSRLFAEVAAHSRQRQNEARCEE